MRGATEGRKGMRAFLLPTVILLLALFASGCATNDLGPVGPPASKVRGAKRVCYIVDISGSTAAPRRFGTYADTIYNTAAESAVNGSGRLCFVFAAGGTVAGSQVAVASVAPDHPDNSDLAVGERRTKVNNALASLLATLKDPPPHTSGSQLFQAVQTAVTRGGLGPGDEIVFLSDMHEFSNLLNVQSGNTFSDGNKATFAKLKANGLLPDLTGITLLMPHINERGQLDADGRLVPSTTPVTRLARVEGLWKAYAAEANGTYSVRVPDPPAGMERDG